MSNENFRTMLVAMLPLTEPMRSTRPKKPYRSTMHDTVTWNQRKTGHAAKRLEQEGES